MGRTQPFDLAPYVQETDTPVKRNQSFRTVLVIAGLAVGAWSLIGAGVWLIIKLV